MPNLDNQPSFFRDLRRRELSGFRVRKRPYLDDLTSESGVLMIEHSGVTCPPLAVSFCKSNSSSHILAVSDEDGYISLYDTRRNLPSLASCRERSGEARLFEWVAHENAIFDVCWTKDDACILTASGDQTIKLWNVEKRTCTGVMAGHTGSIKSLCAHHSNPDLLVSGSRDGSFALWDLRCKPTSRNSRGETRFFSTAVVRGAHSTTKGRRTSRGKAASMSVTSVLYLNDGFSVASAGAADSVVRFWDTRKLKSPIAQASPCSDSSTEKEKKHGISSLSQDFNGSYVTASCMDNKVYLYDVLHLGNGPVKSFSGCSIKTFYVKAAISPDGDYVLSGSSDGNACIWQVDKPESGPMKLEGHVGEVTAVDWCSSELGKIATSSDDYMVRVWSMKKGGFVTPKSPTSVRKRIMATNGLERRRLVMDDEQAISAMNIQNDLKISNKMKMQECPESPAQTKGMECSTPESLKKQKNSGCYTNEGLEMQMTPKAEVGSPSSVLNPPPSLKRTIRDYFQAAS